MIKIRGEEDYPIYSGAKPEIFRIAGELRHSMTPAEKLLWEQLRNRKMMGYRFRRQHPFNTIILDFFCYEALLSIEVDGGIHSDQYQNERDHERTNILKQFGVTELRFTNDEIENGMSHVLVTIRLAIERRIK